MHKTEIPDVLIVEPRVFGDDRGFFLESFNEREMREAGIDAHFVQDNHSRSQQRTELSAENNRLFWIPPGFAHGFLVLSDSADFLYKAIDYYAPEFERTILWNDPDLGVKWPLAGEPILSAKDASGVRFR